MKKKLFYLSLLLISSCASDPLKQAKLENTGKPALHAVQSEKLQHLMRSLNDLMFETMLNEVQIDRKRRQQTEQIVLISGQLLNTLKFFPETIKDLSLDAKERQIFSELSEKLKQQVTLLKQEAEQNYIDAIPNRSNQIIETCNNCHQFFRQLKN